MAAYLCGSLADWFGRLMKNQSVVTRIGNLIRLCAIISADDVDPRSCLSFQYLANECPQLSAMNANARLEFVIYSLVTLAPTHIDAASSCQCAPRHASVPCMSVSVPCMSVSVPCMYVRPCCFGSSSDIPSVLLNLASNGAATEKWVSSDFPNVYRPLLKLWPILNTFDFSYNMSWYTVYVYCDSLLLTSKENFVRTPTFLSWWRHCCHVYTMKAIALPVLTYNAERSPHELQSTRKFLISGATSGGPYPNDEFRCEPHDHHYFLSKYKSSKFTDRHVSQNITWFHRGGAMQTVMVSRYHVIAHRAEQYRWSCSQDITWLHIGRSNKDRHVIKTSRDWT